MEKEIKDIVVKDLYARIPYGVMAQYIVDAGSVTYIDAQLEADDIREFMDPESGVTIKPYLRPMSSMTEEEKKEYEFKSFAEMLDWLLEHHFDFRGLIDKGSALEAPEGMYKF